MWGVHCDARARAPHEPMAFGPAEGTRVSLGEIARVPSLDSLTSEGQRQGMKVFIPALHDCVVK